MPTTYADPTLSLSAQALAILAILGHEPINEEILGDDVEIASYAWYNGRERGASLVVRAQADDNRSLIVTFGEHRRSDDVFVDTWEAEDFWGIPGPGDMPEHEGAVTHTQFTYLRLDSACRHIRDAIERFVVARKKTLAKRLRTVK